MTDISLNLHENGRKLDPRTYSNGKSQTDIVGEILDAFELSDLVYLKGVVGSGKSAIGIRTALEMGGGAISVPTKVLSDQYYDDYYAGDKYFLKSQGGKAKIAVFKGRRNFTCPYLKREHLGWDGWMVSCQNRSIPCRKPVNSSESRFDALEDCPWAAYVRSVGGVPSKFSPEYQTRIFDAVGGEHAVFMKEHDRKPYRCPYWEQYWEIADSDVFVMNSAKFKAETKIGRLPDVPLVVADEGDAFLDGLCPEVDLTQNRVESSVDLMRRNAGKERESKGSIPAKVSIKLEGSDELRRWMAERKERISSLGGAAGEIEDTWNGFLAGEVEPLTAAERVWVLLGACGWETELRTQLTMVFNNIDQVSLRMDLDSDDPGVTFYLPDPKPILRRLLDAADAKVLFMSSTKPSREVLKGTFGIDPVVVEGELEYPGTLVQKTVGKERKVNYDRWQDPGFRSRYERVRDEILDMLGRPAFVPCHGVKYLPARIRDQDLTDKPHIEEDGVTYSTKMDRGADLEEMKSVCLLKYPFPGLGDPLLREMKEHLGESVFWSYYRDMARREFIQQIGRTVRSPSDVVEFWSPDLTCHRKLEKHWEGDIETEGGAT